MAAFLGKLARAVRRDGILPLFRHAAFRMHAAWEAFHDRRLGIDSGGIIEVDELTRVDGRREHAANAVFYQPLSYTKFRRLMRAVPGLAPGQRTFIDFGSGKGRALVLAADLGFRRVVGVEMFPSLCAAAHANIDRYRAHGGRAEAIEVVCADATGFPLPDGDLYCYFYNPFDAPVMSQVLANIEAAIAEQPRSVIIGYANPVCADLLDASPHFELVDDCPSSRTYRNLS